MKFRTPFLLGAATGAAIMYLLDPVNGPERRDVVRRRAEELAERQDVQEVAGHAIDLTRPLHDRGPGADKALTDKVRSEVLGRGEFADLTLNVSAHDGTVTLRGVVDHPSTREELVEAVGRVGGVRRVDSLLHPVDQRAPNMTSS